ncbi:MAG TPA: hypothetical protein VJ927_08795 [Actinomycetota bacterium]|nr:hypothetical protein [Actinomycetota bacterium]
MKRRVVAILSMAIMALSVAAPAAQAAPSCAPHPILDEVLGSLGVGWPNCMP